MKKHILLSPSTPPLHPMLFSMKKRAKKWPDRQLNADEFNMLNRQLCQYLGVQDFKIMDIGLTRDILPKYISAQIAFLNMEEKIPGVDSFSAKSGIDAFVQSVDFSTGALFSGPLPQTTSLLDLSGMMPYAKDGRFINKYLMLRLNETLGTDLDWVVLLEKGDLLPHIALPSAPEKVEGIRLLNFIFEDYSLQKELAIRDYKYKAALLENLISSHPLLSFYIKSPGQRSKTVFSFQTANIPAGKFREMMKEKGFEVGINTGKNSQEYILVANFINHSKEQIEAFVDAVSAEFR